MRQIRSEQRTSSSTGLVAAAIYALFVLAQLVQAPELVTNDTRSELAQRPGSFLSGAFSLWDGSVDFGQFQNQAYGYLFPQGPFFLVLHWLHVSPWIAQRLWSALILVVACEGARRVATQCRLPAGAALLAGIAYACSPRLLGTVAVISAESLPGAVLPWVLLPVLAVLGGRLAPWRGVVFSGAAVVFMGGVNAVEDAASLVLPLVVVLAAWHGRAIGRRFVAAWLGAVLVATAWWWVPLLVLARYGPPFYEYVESAVNTTSVVGWSQALRGDVNWTAYLASDGVPWWPAAWTLATTGWLIVVAAVIAGLGLAGLARLPRHRAPFTIAAGLGFAALVVGHGGAAGDLFSGTAVRLLDGPLQIFRNVHKFDPIVRLPLAIGLGNLVAVVVARVRARWGESERSRSVAILVPVLLGGLVLSLGAPYDLNRVRTPGWDRIPQAWVSARDYLRAHQGDRTTLVVPGSGFAEQTWGWTLDEPLQTLGGVHYVTRSQAPLVPGESIRYLGALDRLVSTGRGTSRLAGQLARAGIGYVLVRRDLARTSAAPLPELSDVSARAAGLVPAAQFGGAAQGGAMIEIYRVPQTLPPVRVTPDDEVRAFRGGPEAVLGLGQAGQLGADTAAEQAGSGPGVATDTPQRREAAFGELGAPSAILGADDPFRVRRATHDYPAGDVPAPVVAKYAGLKSLTASSSQGFGDTAGEIVAAAGPYAAIDEDPATRWVSDPQSDPRKQWLTMTFAAPRPVHEVTLAPVVQDPAMAPITRLEVIAGHQRREVAVDAQTRTVRVRLSGAGVGSVQVRVVGTRTDTDHQPVAISTFAVDHLTPERSLAVPGPVDPSDGFVFTTEAGSGACVPTATGSDCDVARIRQPEETDGMARSVDFSAWGRLRLTGWAVARDTVAAARLLDPLGDRQQVGASSVYGDDPMVSARFAYDGDPDTAWVSDTADFAPTLTFAWARPRRITGVHVVAPSWNDDAPASVRVEAGGRSRTVPLTGTGTGEFKPVTTRRLRLVFSRAPGASVVAVSQLRLFGTDVTVPFSPDAPTGVPCGFGPNVVVGHRRITTEVSGTMGDVVRGTPLRMRACAARGRHGSAVDVASGETTVRTPRSAEFFVTQLAARSAARDAAATGSNAANEADRTVRVESWGSSSRRVGIGAGAASVLWIPQNFNRGWVAELAGHRLEPMRVDGWAQGWRLPAGGAGTVQLRFAPQRWYGVILFGGLGLAALMLLGAVAALTGRRGAPATPTGGRAPARALLGIAAVATAVLLGPLTLLATWIGYRRGPSPGLLVAGVVLAGGSGLIDAWAGLGVHRPAGLLAAAAAGLLMGAALRTAREGAS